MSGHTWPLLPVTFLLLLASIAGTASAAAPVLQQAEDADTSAFQRVWERTDLPVAEGRANRSWIWGNPVTEPMTEPYGEFSDWPNTLPYDERAVQYFDKARMEITDTHVDPSETWYVTNGLLVVEMITGRLQTFDDRFLPLSPAHVNVAGDLDDPDSPTYASLTGLLDAPPRPAGQPITARLDRNGTVTTDDRFAAYAVETAFVEDATGHAIAEPFWDFMTSTGTIWDGANFVDAPLFQVPFYSTGYPITEAYWTKVKLAGVEQHVLLQCFERRCLTYTPVNPEGFVVEAGNVGLHYYQWRYSPQPLAPDLHGEILYTDPDSTNVVDHSGSRRILFAPEGERIQSPALSPDGGRVAYVIANISSPWDANLYVADADGSNPRLLTTEEGEPINSLPSQPWSPEGGRLLFVSDDGTISTIDVDSGAVQEIGPGGHPAWSPAGDRIAFIEWVGYSGEVLKTMNPDGSDVTEVIPGPVDWLSGSRLFNGYAWSPDGSRFVYLSAERAGGNARFFQTLYVVNADGSGNRQIEPPEVPGWHAGNTTGWDPGWTPDGRALTYRQASVVYTIELDGSGARGVLWDFEVAWIGDYFWTE